MLARSYQSECVEHIWHYFGAFEGNPVCALPTGTGKSVCIALFLQSIYKHYPGQKVLILTHVKELIQQNFNKLLAVWPGAPCGIYSAGLNRRDLIQKIIFAGIASIVRRAHELGHVDLVIVDECHLISPTESTMYQKLFTQLMVTNPMLKVIGFTATNYRLGHGKLTEGENRLFTDVCFDITGLEAFNRLVAEGYLARLVPKRTKTQLDTEGVHLRGNEFIAGELQQAVDKESITRAAVEEALHYRDTRKSWLVFASGVEHACHVADMLNEYDIRAVAIHSKMTPTARDEALRLFKSGFYQAVVNNNILTTGFDHPPVDLILCLRPTQSTVLWVQMLGRGTRPYDPARMNLNNPEERALAENFPEAKDDCLVLDFASNAKRLGPINDPVIPRAKGKGGGDAPVKECPICECYVHASLRFCNGIKDDGTDCTHEFIFETKLKQGASSDELIKGDLPVVEVFKVDHINYGRHQKIDRPDSMKVTYYCGYKTFTEYVGVQHPMNSGGARAQRWLRERLLGTDSIPETTDQLIAMAPNLKAATHLRIWINKRYPEILAQCFDGTAFGKEEPGTGPTVESDGAAPFLRHPSARGQQALQPPAGTETNYDDDDIPF